MFDDVIGEPEGAHSIDCVWTNAYKCFSGGRNCCYTVLTVICGLPLALCWGCEFACLTFSHVWQVTPCLKYATIEVMACRKMLSLALSCCLAPCCETIGLLFSKIQVTQA